VRSRNADITMGQPDAQQGLAHRDALRQFAEDHATDEFVSAKMPPQRARQTMPRPAS